MPRSVLIIEDDVRIRRLVGSCLAAEGFAVSEAHSEELALSLVADRRFDVVLLDRTVLGRSGLDICRDLRRVSAAAVIMLADQAESDDIVAGLAAGADDYLTEPFVAKELSARIRALLRRPRRWTERVRVGELEILPRQGLVLRDGVPVCLTKVEFRLLYELAAAYGRGPEPRGPARADLAAGLRRRLPAGGRAYPSPAGESRGRSGEADGCGERAWGRVSAGTLAASPPG